MCTIVALNIALLLYLPISAKPLGQTQNQKDAGTVTGTVKRDGKPAPGITVIATRSPSDLAKSVEQMFSQAPSIKATTDSAGLYRIEGLAPGKYLITPSASPLISSSGNSTNEVTVGEGDTVEDVNFSLSLGGVITGKITDSDGRPVIGERISIKALDDKTAPTGPAAVAAIMGDRMYATDDRGIYRIFGLKPGKYIVSSGKDSDVMNAFLSQRPKRVQTYYPGVTDESKAMPVQVTAGSEAAGVDIQFSSTEKGFLVAGRVVDAQKGTPIRNAMVSYSKAQKLSDESLDVSLRVGNNTVVDSSGTPGGFTTTNDKGEFRFTAVLPGTYKLEATSIGAIAGSGGSQFYADPVSFEITTSNLDKLDIKVHRGASINGIVAVESADPQDNLDRFGQIMLMATVIDSEKSFSSGNCIVAADGSFLLGGLKAGKATIRPIAMSSRRPGLLRVERNGVEVKEFEIHPDEEISGIRVVIASATCVIRGRVTIQGGAIQPGAKIRVTARPDSLNDSFNPPDILGYSAVEAGANGSFVIENLTPGTYQVEAFVVIAAEQKPRTISAKQNVTVTAERPSETELILELGKTSDK
jgi:protocatechuate 3,4-dioxygenase beta subunit